MAKYEATPSISQALRLRQLAGKITQDQMDTIMAEQKKEVMRVTLAEKKLRQFFPTEFTPKQMEDVILQLLANWCNALGQTA